MTVLCFSLVSTYVCAYLQRPIKWSTLRIRVRERSQNAKTVKRRRTDRTIDWRRSISSFLVVCSTRTSNDLSEKRESKIGCHCRDVWYFFTPCFTFSSQFFSTEQGERRCPQTGWKYSEYFWHTPTKVPDLTLVLLTLIIWRTCHDATHCGFRILTSSPLFSTANPYSDIILRADERTKAALRSQSA